LIPAIQIEKTGENRIRDLRPLMLTAETTAIVGGAENPGYGGDVYPVMNIMNN
jgi:hypothetical protein